MTHFDIVRRGRTAAVGGAASVALLLLAACGGGASGAASAAGPATINAAGGVFDASTIHDIAIDLDPEEYAAMVETYQDTGEKEWISATVTIDGETFESVGLRLKGNSSLRSVTQDTAPAEVPWLIRLDKFVDDQSLDGYTEFVVRSNATETALNEAVALDLLEEAGLASERAVAARLSVNGAEETLRLVVQNLDDTWDEENFDTDGVLYKAEAGGDYSYRGEDPASYDEVFDQETDTDEEDLDPLIDFLQFVNEADDETFRVELENHLDVDAFATYLAFEDLIDNFDDIDGPGNNSYLRYDEESGQFTVVAWDHNLAFGVTAMPGGGAAGQQGGPDGDRQRTPMPEGMEPPDGTTPPQGMEPPDGTTPPEAMEAPEGMQPPAGGGGPGGGSNILVERFMADPELEALYQQALADLQASLYDSGVADAVLDSWGDVLSQQAGDLIDEASLTSEVDAIRAHFDQE